MLIEALLLLALLTLGSRDRPGTEEEHMTVVSFEADQVSAQAPEPSSPEGKQRTEERLAPEQPITDEPLPPQPAEPALSQPAEPKVAPIPPIILPAAPRQLPSAAAPRTRTRPVPPGKPLYGPPDTGGSSASTDTERVGTAPNGEPLYAAAWYREPRDGELGDYLSTATGPGWGLIACRTAPDYRVEDCVAIDEYPRGSQINRALLAAAWEFRVRPPRLGGRSLVGAWVSIRIDYSTKRRQSGGPRGAD